MDRAQVRRTKDRKTERERERVRERAEKGGPRKRGEEEEEEEEKEEERRSRRRRRRRDRNLNVEHEWKRLEMRGFLSEQAKSRKNRVLRVVFCILGCCIWCFETLRDVQLRSQVLVPWFFGKAMAVLRPLVARCN